MAIKTMKVSDEDMGEMLIKCQQSMDELEEELNPQIEYAGGFAEQVKQTDDRISALESSEKAWIETEATEDSAEVS